LAAHRPVSWPDRNVSLGHFGGLIKWGERVRKQSLFEKSDAKTSVYAGPWAVSVTTPMPSGAIPTVLRVAGTFSPSAQHNKVFLLFFVH
jgi:hypothetical protein